MLPGAARTGDNCPFTTQCPLNNHSSGRSGPAVRRLLRIFLLFLEATDGPAACAAAAARRADIAIVAEAEAVRVVATGRTGPPAAAAADIVEAATAVAQITRSRIPNRTGAAKLVAEVHSFVRGVVRVAAEITAAANGSGPDAA